MGVAGLLRDPLTGVALLLLLGLKGEATTPLDIARTTPLFGLESRRSKSGSMISRISLNWLNQVSIHEFFSDFERNFQIVDFCTAFL